MRCRGPGAPGGFTLIELVIVIVVAGVLTAYAAMKSSSGTAAYTVLSQAQTLASDMRHAQSLAVSLGTTVRVTVSAGPNGWYAFSCPYSTAWPCHATAGQIMINPATGAAFKVFVEKQVVLSGTGTLDIDSSGNPGAAAGTYTLAAGTTSRTVTVSAISGMVNAQ